jgi:hypothetical protein
VGSALVVLDNNLSPTSMKTDLIQVSLNDADQPVLKFTVGESERTLEHKILGALLRKISLQGIELHLVRTYADAEEKPRYDYEIRAKQPDELDERTPG